MLVPIIIYSSKLKADQTDTGPCVVVMGNLLQKKSLDVSGCIWLSVVEVCTYASNHALSYPACGTHIT